MFASHLAMSADQAPERDLACVDLWQRSIERSRRRREIAALHRKHAPRRKAGSLALSAALLASPLVPLASAQTGGSSGTATEESKPSEADRVVAGDAVLRLGDTGEAVVAVQQKLTVDADGIFGPQTERAVEGFQGRVGLPETGEVDSRTWTELFRSAVSFVPEGSPQAKAIQASVSRQAASVQAEGEDPPRAPRPEPEPSGEDSDRGSSQISRDDAEETRGREDSEPSAGAEADTEAAADKEADADTDAQADADLGEQEGGSRPEAGVEEPSDEPDSEPAVEESEDVSVSGGGSCATGVLGEPTEGTVTSTFGDGRNHGGVDIANATGTAIRAAMCGEVTQAGAQGAYGNIVCIRHTSAFSTCYAHMSEISTREGAYVEIGELVGRMGSTGRSTGPHLHFETRVNGRAHDPQQYLDGERRVPGTSTGGGGEASAASNDSGEASSAQPSSTSSSSGETPTASAQQAEHTGTGGGTPPNGVETEEDHDPREFEYESSAQGQAEAQPQQQAAAQPAPEQAPAQEQEPAPVEQEQAPAEEESTPAEAPAPSAEVAATQSVEVTPEASVEEAAAAPAEEAAAPVETAAPVEEAAAPVEEAAAPVVSAVG